MAAQHRHTAGSAPTVRDEAGMDRCISEIRAYRALTENWDTYGGRGASEQAVRFAVGLLEELRGCPDIPPPRIAPISHGVYLEWRIGVRSLYIEVDDESAACVFNDGGCEREVDSDFALNVAGAARTCSFVERHHSSMQ